MSKKYKDGRDDTPNAPNAGVTLHPEKAAHDRKQGRAGLNKPEAGARDRGKDPKNATHPDAGVADPHSDKHAYERARRHEPKPAKGAKYADGSTTTKC